MQANEILELSICLSDIPREKMVKLERNGKIYLNLDVALRKEPDQWGRDLKVMVHRNKEQRDNGEALIYCGAGRSREIKQAATIPDESDMPF